MIVTIGPHPNGARILSTEEDTVINRSVLSIVRRLCLEGLFSHEGYVKAVKKAFGFKYLIPIYISDQLALIPLGRIKNHETVWLNVAAMTGIHKEDHQVIITMRGNHRIETNLSEKRIDRRIQTLLMIREAKVKHFHCVSYSKWPELML